jgi:hypothetical protein
MESGERYTEARAIPAEGARCGIITCKECGAAIFIDPDDGFSPKAIHDDWHKKQMDNK